MNRILTRLDLDQARAYYETGQWGSSSIHALVTDIARATPERVAFLERDRAVTYAELRDAGKRLAAHLRSTGLTAGDRVAVWLPNRAEVAATVFACAQEGFVCAPSLHRDHTVAQVVELLDRMKAAAFIGQPAHGADAERRDVFAELSGLSEMRTCLALDPPIAGESLFGELPNSPAAFGCENGAPPDAVVYVAFTSGSTGRPKGVLHTSNTLMAPISSMARDWGIGKGSVLYSLSPLSHNLGFGAMLMAICLGGTLVGHDLPRGSSIAQRLRETRAVFAFGVPTHVIDLLRELETGEVSTLPDLLGFRVSGASVSPAVAAQLLERGITPQSGYGMTEAGNLHYTRRDDHPETITTSSGRPFTGHAVKVVDREDIDRELPRGEIGQILARGPSLMMGYFDDQAATERAFTEDGWLATGDLGWVDAEDNVRITGRKKDVIIRGGHNIFPARIENLADTAVGVSRTAAIPVPDERLGERVGLIVARDDPKTDVEPSALLQHLDDVGLSKYDMPEFVGLVDDMPLLPSGKLDKLNLIERMRSGELSLSSVRFRSTS